MIWKHAASSNVFILMGAYLLLFSISCKWGAEVRGGCMLPKAPNQASDACILATGLWCVRTRIKVLCDTELWATEEIGMFAFF